MIDLSLEFKILSVIKHPHIIKMRGTCFGDPFQRDSFILLDRLHQTLMHQLAIWKKNHNNIFYRFKKSRKKMFMMRLVVARDLASAFDYLHNLNIVYRDLKPDNVGFDVRGDVKLFDFGLAKEIKPANSSSCDVFELSGHTGSLRYMAPEVALEKPYNLTVDVYSFGILLWQMLSLTTPFAGYNVRMHRKMVVDEGFRPRLDKKWPLNIRNLLTNCWSRDISKRPGFGEIYRILKNETYESASSENLALDMSCRTARSLDLQNQ